MMNFNEIFRENVTYDNIKNQGFTLSLQKTISEKPQGRGQIETSQPC